MSASLSFTQAKPIRNFLALLIAVALIAPLYAQDVERRVDMVSMRDGVKLATNIYLPEGDGPWPTVLTRTPYNKIAQIAVPPATTNTAMYWCHRTSGVAMSPKAWISPLKLTCLMVTTQSNG
jgi:hypothetical protein